MFGCPWTVHPEVVEHITEQLTLNPPVVNTPGRLLENEISKTLKPRREAGEILKTIRPRSRIYAPQVKIVSILKGKTVFFNDF